MLSTDTDFRGKHSRLATWASYEAAHKESFVLNKLAAATGQLVLDDGCGNGRFSIALARMGCHVIARDLSSVLIKQAQISNKERGIQFIRADMTRLPIRESVLDRILCVSNLWYVKRFELAIDEMQRTLKIGGICVADQLNLLDFAKLRSWRFYAAIVLSFLGRAFIDVGRTASTFSKPFSKMSYRFFSVTGTPPKQRIVEGKRRFASRFIEVATKI